METLHLINTLIDMRSFANLWYWIALAVTWSSVSHWVLGVPWDMVLRARRKGGQAQEDLDAITHLTIRRMLTITREAGVALVTMTAFLLSLLGSLGFWYRVELAQAIFLLMFPLTFVGALSLSLARVIEAEATRGPALIRRLSRHRRWVQLVGGLSILVTTFYGMAQNFNLSILGH